MSTLAELIQNNASLSYIREQGYTVKQIVKYDPDIYYIENFVNAGYTIQEILNTNGYFRLYDFFNIIPIQTIIDNNYTLTDLLYNGFSVLELKPNFPLIDFYNIYISQSLDKQMIDMFSFYYASYTVEELKNVGFTGTQLYPVFTITRLRLGGFTVTDLYPDFTIQQLKDGRFPVSQFKTAGLPATQLYPIFSIHDLYPDFTIKELIDSTIIEGTVNAFKNNNFTIQEMYSYFTLAELKAAGFTI
jgi:hypothetical protein